MSKIVEEKSDAQEEKKGASQGIITRKKFPPKKLAKQHFLAKKIKKK